jgi:hypothetical protein
MSDRPEKAATTRRREMRKILNSDNPPKSPFLSPIGKWFTAHPEAQMFLEMWLSRGMRGAVKRKWSVRAFHQEILVERYEFPWTCSTNFGRWVQKAYPKQYKLMMEVRRLKL